MVLLWSADVRPSKNLLFVQQHWDGSVLYSLEKCLLANTAHVLHDPPGDWLLLYMASTLGSLN